MASGLKQISRSILRSKLTERCICQGIVQAYSRVWGSFGMNQGNNIRVLLKNVEIDNIHIDHMWVNCIELNKKEIYEGRTVKFNALVYPYQKSYNRVGIGLIDLQDIHL